VIDIDIVKMRREEIDEVAQLISDVYDYEKIWDGYRFELIKKDLEYDFALDDKKFHHNHVDFAFFLAKNGEKIVGVAGIKTSPMSSSVFELCWATVIPEFQRKGVGSKLIKARLDWAKEKEEHSIIMTNTRFLNLFEKFNFITIFAYENDPDSPLGGLCYLRL